MSNREHPVPGPNGRPQALAEKCGTCVFRPGDPMRLGADRLRDLVRANRAAGAVLTCHQTLSYGEHADIGQAACRGYLDAYGDEAAAARAVRVLFGGWDEIPAPPAEGAPR